MVYEIRDAYFLVKVKNSNYMFWYSFSLLLPVILPYVDIAMIKDFSMIYENGLVYNSKMVIATKKNCEYYKKVPLECINKNTEFGEIRIM